MPSNATNASSADSDRSPPTSPHGVQLQQLSLPEEAKETHIAFLYSEPLISADHEPIVPVDFESEKQLLIDCLNESNRSVSIRFEAATVENLRTLVTKRVKILHYSGHATPDKSLSFEDARGSLHRNFTKEKLKHLFQAGNTAGVDLVFVAACNSEFVGHAFVEAGVRHVIAVKCTIGNDVAGLVTDKASRIFAHAVYLALLLGKKVKEAFEIGKARVEADSHQLTAQDARKFLLLPQNGDHERVLFDEDSLKVGQWVDTTPKLSVRFAFALFLIK
jgi:hypothetical protein